MVAREGKKRGKSCKQDMVVGKKGGGEMGKKGTTSIDASKIYSVSISGIG